MNYNFRFFLVLFLIVLFASLFLILMDLHDPIVTVKNRTLFLIIMSIFSVICILHIIWILKIIGKVHVSENKIIKKHIFFEKEILINEEISIKFNLFSIKIYNKNNSMLIEKNDKNENIVVKIFDFLLRENDGKCDFPYCNKKNFLILNIVLITLLIFLVYSFYYTNDFRMGIAIVFLCYLFFKENIVGETIIIDYNNILIKTMLKNYTIEYHEVQNSIIVIQDCKPVIKILDTNNKKHLVRIQGEIDKNVIRRFFNLFNYINTKGHCA